MKFDFVIGNPPYQDSIDVDSENKTFMAPVYNLFMDASFQIGEHVELIHPARFLFNAGQTPKAWNEKMLADEHFKVLFYEADGSQVFANTEIKGGIAITYRDKKASFGAIQIFTKFPELNAILHKVTSTRHYHGMNGTVISRTAYRLTDALHRDFPDAINRLSKGHAYDMSTNIFDRIPFAFFNQKPEDGKEYIQILGREDGGRSGRIYKYIRAEYVNHVVNLKKYKVLLASANGNGEFGETLATPIICQPNVGNTETFVSVGSFETEKEAQACLKYIQGKFSRALLGVLKVTQHITPDKWQYVPLQDFTTSSDIDWSQSIAQIDQQLYRKYGLTDEEIDFIETHVKEMT